MVKDERPRTPPPSVRIDGVFALLLDKLILTEHRDRGYIAVRLIARVIHVGLRTLVRKTRRNKNNIERVSIYFTHSSVS